MDRIYLYLLDRIEMDQINSVIIRKRAVGKEGYQGARFRHQKMGIYQFKIKIKTGKEEMMVQTSRLKRIPRIMAPWTERKTTVQDLCISKFKVMLAHYL